MPSHGCPAQRPGSGAKGWDLHGSPQLPDACGAFRGLTAFSTLGGGGAGTVAGMAAESSHPFPCCAPRTESVAEKMLTNWFTFLLYKFLKVGG